MPAWAHDCEEMMLDAGYGNADPRLRLAQLAEALLREVRLIAAIEMHTRGMSKDTAARMFVEEAYLDPLPAEREATRGIFDPEYLNYTVGKLMIKKSCTTMWGNKMVPRFHRAAFTTGYPIWAPRPSPWPVGVCSSLGPGAVSLRSSRAKNA